MGKNNICPNCFSENNTESEKCSFCGYRTDAKSKNVFALSPGTVIAERFLIGRVLGSGGFGITYKAKDILTEEVCAVKEYFPTSCAYRKPGDNNVYPISEAKNGIFQHGRKNFIDEAKILIKFKNDENIVHVENFLAVNNTAYLVMEFLDGTNYKTLINKQNGKIPFSIGVDVFITVANALDRIHSHDILHRDISPENIFITNKAQIKLIDFGSARQMIDGSMSVLLKHGFAPIEQYSSTGKQGAWTDIYSLAATFYLSVTGKQVPDSRSRVKTDELERLEKNCPDASVEWGDVIEKALKVDASERYRSVGEMMEDVGKVMTRFGTDEEPEPPKIIPYILIEKCKYEGSWSRVKKIYIEKNKQFTFGRSYQVSDYVVDMADYISRAHCVIFYSEKNGCFFVKDVSSNGTYFYNGVRLKKDTFIKVDINSKISLGANTTVLKVGVDDESRLV